MKRVFISLLLMITIGLAKAYAKDEMKINEKAATAFKKEFTGYEVSRWRNIGEYSIALFVLNGHSAAAYFNADDELQGSVRDLFFDELPLPVIISLNRHFTGADIIEIREVTNTDGTFYRLLVETQQKKYHLKIDTVGNFSEIVKIKSNTVSVFIR